MDKKERKLFESLLAKHGIEISDFFNSSYSTKNHKNPAMVEYDEVNNSLIHEYQQRINTEIMKIENNYTNDRNIQTAISANISRISPISCFTYIISEIAGSGILEMNNFLKNAKIFQQKVKQDIYNNYIREEYKDTSGRNRTKIYPVEGFDPQKAPVPHMSDYTYTTLEQALKATWFNIVLLAFFSILFFTASFVSFIRYDVR